MVKMERYSLVGCLIEESQKHIAELEEFSKYIDVDVYIRNEYARLERLEAEKKDIIDSISDIEDDRTRTMAYLYYIKGYTKRKIADFLGINERYLHRIWKNSEVLQ